ncbi:GNAT family N-acetyltransferase [Nocardioides cavernae]|uniref:GNAT family N-acetyltransferase n=1 Tax=Nocardioides cavernae TaxID=1921566 RepID=A0ABR8NEZ8_9ACTN|nr:GNAT family protein [Nocardioides cavernae]MBD3926709.1 GNAT family N-acetyltransferase [Nocardioides cavernae]MBM7512431.1 RimJ/RimL family protein N-acetyltransferase [Nocardioides cavernae]
MTGPVGVRLSATRTRTTNDHGQPLGRPVEWTGATAPAKDVVLEGRGVRLEPIGAQHADDLFAALCRVDDDALWTYLAWERPRDREQMVALVEQLATDDERVFVAIVPTETDRAAGFCGLMRIDPQMGSIEVGAIALGRQLQRSRAATELQALLMRHVFDDLGFRRYEWKCDSLNAPSRRAALRLGFIWEGRFRNALVYKGRNRDTDWFSITDGEWPRVRTALDAWLDDDNFDDTGRQRTRLAARAPRPDQQEA